MQVPEGLSTTESLIYLTGLIAGAEASLEELTSRGHRALLRLEGKAVDIASTTSHRKRAQACRGYCESGALVTKDAALAKAGSKLFTRVLECINARDFLIHGIWIQEEGEDTFNRLNAGRGQFVNTTKVSRAEALELVRETRAVGGLVRSFWHLTSDLQSNTRTEWIFETADRYALGLPPARDPEDWEIPEFDPPFPVPRRGGG